jgi:hypothetical protein
MFSVKAAMSSSRFTALSSTDISLPQLTLRMPKETKDEQTCNGDEMAKLALDPNATYATYIMQSGCGRYVKIGYTCNLKKRFSEVKCEAKYDWWREKYVKGLRIIATVPGGYDVEAEIHARFDHLRIYDANKFRQRSGKPEWFRLERDLVQFIMEETMPFTDYQSVVYGAYPRPTPPQSADERSA